MPAARSTLLQEDKLKDLGEEEQHLSVQIGERNAQMQGSAVGTPAAATVAQPPAPASFLSLPGDAGRQETERERLIRTGVITPFEKVAQAPKTAGKERKSESAMLRAEVSSTILAKKTKESGRQKWERELARVEQDQGSVEMIVDADADVEVVDSETDSGPLKRQLAQGKGPVEKKRKTEVSGTGQEEQQQPRRRQLLIQEEEEEGPQASDALLPFADEVTRARSSAPQPRGQPRGKGKKKEAGDESYDEGNADLDDVSEEEDIEEVYHEDEDLDNIELIAQEGLMAPARAGRKSQPRRSSASHLGRSHHHQEENDLKDASFRVSYCSGSPLFFSKKSSGPPPPKQKKKKW